MSTPPSSKRRALNRENARDPEMHQTRKGNQWHFGMKMHIGVDDTLGLIHCIETTAANEHDLNVAARLLHGGERHVWADAGYAGIDNREEHRDRSVDWSIAMRPGRRAQLPESSATYWVERLKASVRAKVEHPFCTIKRQFGYGKVRYRGLAKNTNRLHVLAAFSNLLRAQKYLPV